MAKYLNDPKYVLFNVENRVARITLNKPEKRNALNDDLLIELQNALLEADSLKDVNCVVLQGAGKDFCAGYDLVGFYEGDFNPEDYRARGAGGGIDSDIWYMECTQRLTMTIFDMHKPVIARLHGNCLAGGTDIALMCDFIICTEETRIGFPATRANGTPPNNWWLYHVGPQWAKRLILTGDSVLGRDAAKIRLVLDAVPEDKLDEAVDDLAHRLAHVDPDMLAAHKRVVNMGLELMGARTMQRFCVEVDGRAHLVDGPRRTQFKQDMASGGFKQALANRDAPFGDGFVHAHWLEKEV